MPREAEREEGGGWRLCGRGVSIEGGKLSFRSYLSLIVEVFAGLRSGRAMPIELEKRLRAFASC